MVKKAILIHGWGGNPEEGWIKWVGKKLEEKGYEVEMPIMPDSLYPKIDTWVGKLKEVARQVDEETLLIGHSIGCQTIMRYLGNLEDDVKVGKVIFVGGWFNLTDETYEDEEDKEIALPWIEIPIDFDKVKEHCKEFILINSDDDPYVPLSDADLFKEKLNADVIMLKDKGHITGNELPEVLEFVD